MPKPPKPHNKVDPRSLANLRPFAPGTSGNPKGSPNGSRHKVSIMLEAMLDGQSEALVQKVIAMALDGNEMALKACIDRLIPIRRGRTVRFQLPPINGPDDAATATTMLLAAVSGGELTPTEANELAGVLESYTRAVEVSAFEQRIRKLEGRMPIINGQSVVTEGR